MIQPRNLPLLEWIEWREEHPEWGWHQAYWDVLAWMWLTRQGPIKDAVV